MSVCQNQASSPKTYRITVFLLWNMYRKYLSNICKTFVKYVNYWMLEEGEGTLGRMECTSLLMFSQYWQIKDIGFKRAQIWHWIFSSTNGIEWIEERAWMNMALQHLVCYNGMYLKDITNQLISNHRHTFLSTEFGVL